MLRCLEGFMAFLIMGASIRINGQPPLGPRNRAKCPVTDDPINITDSTPAVFFNNGQRLYFSTMTAARMYARAPRDYWLAPHDIPLQGMDGKRGLPDFRNKTLRCPYSDENMTISMQTPRVVHKGGQNIYFCCFGCVNSFWTNPASAINNSSGRGSV